MRRYWPWNVLPNKSLINQARELRLKKGLSQNFLVDNEVLVKIAQVALKDLSLDESLIEIGPGAGFLTRYLLASGHPLTAIELDSKMIRVLTDEFGDNPLFHLIHQDVLKVDLAPLLREKGVVVGNLPYHITGPILFKLMGELEETQHPVREKLSKAILMVQKEVGERLVAKPGSKAYSQLSVQTQFWFEVQWEMLVPKPAFFPAPKVDSAVLSLIPRQNPPVIIESPTLFSRLIKASFMHRRKKLLNNLKLGQFGEESHLKMLLESLGISLDARAQDLSVIQFGALANALDHRH